jgi:hypothetical protein
MRVGCMGWVWVSESELTGERDSEKKIVGMHVCDKELCGGL